MAEEDDRRRGEAVNPARRLTYRVRARVPKRAETAVRRVMLRWGMLTAPVRMLPDTIIVGAQRSGTTTLFRMLSEHPQVVRPTLSKGTAYFDLHHERGHEVVPGPLPVEGARLGA